MSDTGKVAFSTAGGTAESAPAAHPADPLSPAVPVKLDTIQGSIESENDDEKIILTLESLHYSNENDDAMKKMEENKRALEKLEKLLKSNSITKKKIVKDGEEEKFGFEFVSIDNKDDNGKPRILNTALAKATSNEKRILNNAVRPIPSEDDLLAILEGNNRDEETDVDVKVIESKKKNVTTVIVSKNDEIKIAADQMKHLSKKKTQKEGGAGSELINQIASEWSDNERDSSSENNIQKKKIVKQIVKVKKQSKNLPTLPKSSRVQTPQPVKEEESNVNAEIKSAEKPDQVTGLAPFKRSRIIKKKIIWDPDAPETSFSYASLIKPKSKAVPPKKVQKKTVSSTAGKKTQENKKIPDKTKTATAGRKRKEPSPDNDSEKIEEALKAILNEETEKKQTKTDLKESSPVKKPRIAKPNKPSSSWDYLNKSRSEDMMIIRRRSSSYSSTTSPRRLSLEQQSQQVGKVGKQTDTSSDQKVIKIVKTLPDDSQATKKRRPEVHIKKESLKKIDKNDEIIIKTTPVAPLVKKLSLSETKKLAPPIPTAIITSTTKPVIIKKNVKQNSEGERKIIIATPISSGSSTNYKQIRIEKKSDANVTADIDITLKKMNSVINFVIEIKSENLPNTLSVHAIRKFISTLEHLKMDKDCKVVVLTSKGTNFCQGIDFSYLLAGSSEKRKVAAVELAKYIKLLFETLIHFNKPIIAAVSGVVLNLGVTMLPLFDAVFASDKCAFEMTYAKIGQIPEGNCIMANTNINKQQQLKLIYLAEKITAAEALSAGLISAIYPAQRFETEALNVAGKMASLSQVTIKSMKEARMKKFANEDFMKQLDEEESYLIQHWTSAECQENFKVLLDKK